MSQAMLSNYDCIKANNPDGSMEGAVRARETCPINVVQGLENVTLLPIKNRIQNAKNITERQDAVDELGRVRNFQQDILLMANNLNSIKAPNIDTKTALMSNLIDLHLGLISTSEEVEARLRPMYTNCMKAQPVIPCPKP